MTTRQDMPRRAKRRMRQGWDGYVMSFLSYGIVGLFAIICVIPILYVISYSVTPYAEYLKNPYSLIPRDPNLLAYKQVLASPYIGTGYRMTVTVTLVGTVLGMLVMICTAYPLTKKDLKGRNFLLTLWIITMFFNGGMIPGYLLVRELNLLNTPWALILPPLLGCQNLILMKNYMNGLPISLEEAARIDGANELVVLARIIVPLSLPIIATLALFTAVWYWNSYFTAILYMTKRQNWPLQLVLREMVIEGNIKELAQTLDDGARLTQPFTLKMATIVVCAVPIMCVYPFMQKYFIGGLTLGGVKE